MRDPRSSGRKTYPAAGVLDDPVKALQQAPVRSPASEKGLRGLEAEGVATLGETGSAVIFKKERTRGIEIVKVG